jgi:hypothetical protein
MAMGKKAEIEKLNAELADAKTLIESLRNPPDKSQKSDKPAVPDVPPELLWLSDAPLFIDDLQVNAFYDAVLRPDYELTSVALGNSISAETTVGGSVSMGAAFPFIGSAQLEASAEYARTNGRTTDRTLTPISNSYRHLLTMALYYLGRAPDRVMVSETNALKFREGETPEWLADAFILDVPRPLVFLDVAPGTEFMPAALETTGEPVNVVADKVAEQFKARDVLPKVWPGSKSTPEAKHDYFIWFKDNFDVELSLKAVEAAAGSGNLEWIDFNIPLGTNAEVFMHLHFDARTNYSTSVFAYNLIRRGFNHGLRLVGTLKTGPDLNVLAVFEH